MGRREIRAVIKKAPALNNYGMGVDYQAVHMLSMEERKKQFREDQEKLLKNVKQFENACHWWAVREKIESFNTKHTSYGLKHEAEEDIGYVTNGAFIAAAIRCGFNYHWIDNSINVMFNVSEKSLKKPLPFRIKPLPAEKVFRMFCTEKLTSHQGAKAFPPELYKAYREFCANKCSIPGRNTFYRMFEAHHHVKRQHTHRGTRLFYVGVALRVDSPLLSTCSLEGVGSTRAYGVRL